MGSGKRRKKKRERGSGGLTTQIKKRGMGATAVPLNKKRGTSLARMAIPRKRRKHQ